MLICCLMSATYYQFLTLANQILIHRFDQTEEGADKKITIMILESIITTPIFGILVDKYGRKPLFILISSFLSTAAFFAFFFLPVERSELIHIPILLLSQYFSIFNTVIWPVIMISVPSRSVGVSLGISSLIESSLMTILPILFGFILENNTIDNYQLCLIAFCALSLFSFILCIFLLKYDYKNGKLLTRLEDDPYVERLRRRMTKKLKIEIESDGKSKQATASSGSDEEEDEEEKSEISGSDLGRKELIFERTNRNLKRKRFLSEKFLDGFGEPEGLNEKLEEKADRLKEELDVSIIEENK